MIAELHALANTRSVPGRQQVQLTPFGEHRSAPDPAVGALCDSQNSLQQRTPDLPRTESQLAL